MDGVLSGLGGFLLGFVIPISSIISTCVYGLLQALVSLGLVMGDSSGVPFEHDVHCCLVFALV